MGIVVTVPEVPGMSVNIAMMPSPLPIAHQLRWPEKQRRVYRWLLERRPRHHDGGNGSADAMGLFSDGVSVGGSGTRRVKPRGERVPALHAGP